MKYGVLRKLTVLLFLILIFKPLHSQVFFSGQVGAGVFLSLENKSFYPALAIQGDFSGQIEFSPNILLRMNFSGITNNIFSAGHFENIPSRFSIDGISLSYRHSIWPNYHNYLTLFLNEEDPIGSDSFLRRYFGATHIASDFTRNRQNSQPAGIYAMKGLGFSYIIRFPQPVALAAYAYVSNPSGGIGLNADLRFAGKWNMFTIDAMFGINADGSTKDAAGNNVLLLIKTVTMRAALTMLIGSETSSNLFMQIGIYRGLVYPKSNAKIGLEDIFGLFEPRFRIGNSRLNFSFFIFPEAVAKTLFYVDEPIGFNIAWLGDSVFAQNISAGINASVTSKSVLDPQIIIQNLDFALTPVLTVKTGGGNFDFAFKIRPLKFVSSISEAMTLKIGYKTQL